MLFVEFVEGVVVFDVGFVVVVGVVLFVVEFMFVLVLFVLFEFALLSTTTGTSIIYTSSIV